MSIKVNDRVAFSKSFLQSTGQLTGSIPFARGNVVNIKDYGSFKLATVDWQDGDIPSKINVKNLRTVKQVQTGE